MKLLFAHDHVFYQYNHKYYSSGGLSKEMLERYTNVFDEVIVLSRQKKLSDSNDKLTLASTDGINFVKVPNFKSIRSIHKIIESREIINKEVAGCDLLIARLPSSIGSLAVKYAQKHNKPYLLEVVACPWDALWNHSLRGKLIAPYKFFKTRKLVNDANYVLYVTNEFLQKRYPSKGKSINCSNVALREFDDNVLKNRIIKINKMKENMKVVIGTAAAVDVRYKGQQYIIKALARLKKQGITNYEYQLVGGGDQTYLKSIAKKYCVSDQIKFLGSMSHNEVFKWLDTIDIYVQPSRQEGLPRALIEAMSRGLPAFGAKTGGIPELLDPEFIFSNTYKNIDEICELIKSLNIDAMINQAKRNYEVAKRYDKSDIEERRRAFFERFKYSIGD